MTPSATPGDPAPPTPPATDTALVRNDRGEWLLVMPAQAGEPDADALLLIDDGARAGRLLRRADQAIDLPGLHARAAADMATATEVLVVELTDDGDPARAYPVSVSRAEGRA